MNWFSWIMWNVVGPGLWIVVVGYGFCAIVSGLQRKFDEKRQKFYDEYRNRKRWPDA